MFGFLKRNMLKSLEWLDDSKDVIVYRYPMDGRQIMWGSKVTVRQSQVAVFVNKGKVADIFEAGTHHLSAANLPILTELLSLPYGFKSPFFSEVYFVNTKQFTNQKWGTSNPITMRDKDFGTIRIKSYGTFAYKVNDVRVFLNELFGTNSTFKTEDITNYLKSMLVSTMSDVIAESRISALDMACNLTEFNEVVSSKMVENFTKLGLQLTNFVIENISFPEEVEKAIDTRSSMGVLGDTMDTYMKYQTANAMRDSANNPASGNMANMGVGLGAGMAMGNMMKDVFSSQNSSNTQNNTKEEKKKFCGNCGCEMKINAKFCPECGEKQSTDGTCLKCGESVGPKSKFCNNCGEKLK